MSERPLDLNRCIYLTPDREEEAQVQDEVDDGNELPFALQRSGRFGHSRRYLNDLLRDRPFVVKRMESCILRVDRGIPVHGILVALVKMK